MTVRRPRNAPDPTGFAGYDRCVGGLSPGNRHLADLAGGLLPASPSAPLDTAPPRWRSEGRDRRHSTKLKLFERSAP
jgi:hypothetical protein